MTGLLVFNYHGIEAAKGEYVWHAGEYPYVVSREDFKAHLDMAADNFTLSLGTADIEPWLLAHHDKKAVLFTFDDGLMSHYDHAAPLLRAAKGSGLFFVPTGWIGTAGHMDWSHLDELKKQGFEIGSHGIQHRPLTYLSAGELRHELRGSKDVLEDRLGAPVWSLSIPRGFFNKRIAEEALKAGYRFIFTSRFDVLRKGRALSSIPRLAIERHTTREEFRRLLHAELGMKRYTEQFKETVRGMAPPRMYERLARIKQAVFSPRFTQARNREARS